MHYASDQNKFTMFYAVNSSEEARHFYFASALLSDGYFFNAPTSTQWFAEHGTYTGNPTGKAYQLQGFTGVWARDYTAAKVIVNPTSNVITVDMPGYVDLNGNPATKISINPNDAAILKSRWSAWESLSGYLTASPAAVSSADGRIDVFGQGSDHALWHRSYANNAWSSWESLGGQLLNATGPAVSSQAAGQLDVFVTGRGDHALWHRTYT